MFPKLFFPDMQPSAQSFQANTNHAISCPWHPHSVTDLRLQPQGLLRGMRASLTFHLYNKVEPVSMLVGHSHTHWTCSFQLLCQGCRFCSAKPSDCSTTSYKQSKLISDKHLRGKKSIWRTCQRSQLWHWQGKGCRAENLPQTTHLSSYNMLCTNWHNLRK